MAASSPTVLAHVAWMLRGSFEDLAVEALGYILNSSKTATQALEVVVRDGGQNVSSIRMVQTQVVEETGATPDLSCLDEDGEKHVLIEAKFDAMLTKNQPVQYLKHLPDDRSSVLLVVAPKRRIEPLWKEMMDLVRASGDFAVGEEAVSESLIGAPVSECSTLMLVSWEHLLLQLAMRAEENSDRDTLRSIAELQGVVEYEALNAFQAPSKDLAELDEKNRERFKQLIDGAIAEGRGECWASTDGYGPGGGVTGYIRYFATGEVPMWFGYDMRLWEALRRASVGGISGYCSEQHRCSSRWPEGALRKATKGLLSRRPLMVSEERLHTNRVALLWRISGGAGGANGAAPRNSGRPERRQNPPPR